MDVGAGDATRALSGSSIKLKASGLAALPHTVAPGNTGLFTPKLVTTKYHVKFSFSVTPVTFQVLTSPVGRVVMESNSTENTPITTESSGDPWETLRESRHESGSGTAEQRGREGPWTGTRG